MHCFGLSWQQICNLSWILRGFEVASCTLGKDHIVCMCSMWFIQRDIKKNVAPRDRCKLSSFHLLLFSFPPPSLPFALPFSVFSSCLHSFFSLYIISFNNSCFVGPGKLHWEIQTWYCRQRGDIQWKFFRNKQNHLLINLSFVHSIEYFSHDQLKIRVNGNNCGHLGPIDDLGDWSEEPPVNVDLV